MPTRFIRYAALVVALLGSSSIAFAQETVPDTRTDRWLTNPVGDATFQTYLEFFAYNKSLPFDVVVGETTTEQGIVRQHVTYQSTQQITVTAYLYRQESPTAGSRGGIIYLHGGRGAVLSSIAGAAETRLAGVALLHGGHFGLLVQSHRPAACPANYIGRISPRPLLMFNTTSDTYFLPETTIRPWIRLARDPMEIHWTDTPHGFMSEEDRSTMLAWLRKR